MVQWLRLYTFNAAGAGLMPGWRTKILHAVGHGQKKKKVKWGWNLSHPLHLGYLPNCFIQMEDIHSN